MSLRVAQVVATSVTRLTLPSSQVSVVRGQVAGPPFVAPASPPGLNIVGRDDPQPTRREPIFIGAWTHTAVFVDEEVPQEELAQRLAVPEWQRSWPHSAQTLGGSLG
jgi:hypothetical protein